MNNLFRQLRAFTNEMEAIVIEWVAGWIPWLAPVIPAYIAYQNIRYVLGFPHELSLIGAAVVEGLGLAAVHTVIQFWDYNQTKRKTDSSAPVYIVVVVGAFYLAIVLTVNIILDNASVDQLVAKALLSLISVPAVVTLAVRSQHKQRILEIEAEKKDKKRTWTDTKRDKAADKKPAQDVQRPAPTGKPEARAVQVESHPNGQNGYVRATGSQADWRLLNESERVRMIDLTSGEIVERYRVDNSTARRWLRNARKLAQSNGHMEPG